MTARIIYHDFSKEQAPKEPRLVKLTEQVNKGLHSACLFLCGACTAIGLLVIVLATVGF